MTNLSRTFYFLDISKPMRYETMQDIKEQRIFELNDMPTCLAPSFKEPSNKKLNDGHYELVKVHPDGSLVYAYNFVKTTAASSATFKNLELLSATGPQNVNEFDIIRELPDGATFHHFRISREGLGKDQHQKAIATTIERTARKTLEGLKREMDISPAIEETVLSNVIPPMEEGTTTAILYISFHETDCTKQFFEFAAHYYPQMNVLSERRYGQFVFSALPCQGRMLLYIIPNLMTTSLQL